MVRTLIKFHNVPYCVTNYVSGWNGRSSIGNSTRALTGDYLDQDVWNHVAANYIAIVRHDDNMVHAVKTFKIIYDQGYTLGEVRRDNIFKQQFRTTV